MGLRWGLIISVLVVSLCVLLRRTMMKPVFQSLGGWADGGVVGTILDFIGVFPSGGLVLDGIALGITGYVTVRSILSTASSDLIRLLAGTSAIGLAITPLRKFCLIYHNEYPGLTFDVALFSVGVLAATEVLSAPFGMLSRKIVSRAIQALVLPGILVGISWATQHCLLPWQFQDTIRWNWRNSGPIWPITPQAICVFAMLGFVLRNPCDLPVNSIHPSPKSGSEA